MHNKSNRRWLREHFSDPYVKKAHQAGLRSRSVFKLQELQEKDQLFKPGMTVIDIGAAPGGWSAFVAKIVGKSGKVIALDILSMKPIEGVECIQGDFNEQSVMDALLAKTTEIGVDWVISDIAPNLSGIETVDQAKSMALAELVLAFALRTLKKKGGLLIKLFQGEGFDDFLLQLRRNFEKVVIRKPKASRGRSREIYILVKMLSL